MFVWIKLFYYFDFNYSQLSLNLKLCIYRIVEKIHEATQSTRTQYTRADNMQTQAEEPWHSNNSAVHTDG